jgi:hypothetical protein
MPVIATPVVKKSGIVEDVRLFMRDFYDKNPLHADIEFTDEEINAACRHAVDLANAIGRPTSYTVSAFPNNYVLMLGASGHLTKSEAIRQLRNQSQFQDGNIQGVGMDEKYQFYMQLSQSLTSEFRDHVTQIKITSNIHIRGFRSPLARSFVR